MFQDEQTSSFVKNKIKNGVEQDIISGEFIRKLESLLQRAYRLQEEFEGAMGFAEPAPHHSGESIPTETQEAGVSNTEPQQSVEKLTHDLLSPWKRNTPKAL